MKQWNIPELVELNLDETAHEWFGSMKDGGYLGDGTIGGHLTFNPDEEEDPCKPKPTPTTKLS